MEEDALFMDGLDAFAADDLFLAEALLEADFFLDLLDLLLPKVFLILDLTSSMVTLGKMLSK